MKSKLFLVLAIILVASIGKVRAQNNQDHPVYWIHGLNEDASSWAQFCEELTPENGICLEYDSNHAGGISGIAQELNSQIPSNEYVILVGHSAGGLVARSIQQINPKVIGVITVGTPNYGAPIVNSMQASAYQNIVERLATSITDAITTARNDVLSLSNIWFLSVLRNPMFELASSMTSAQGFVAKIEDEAKLYFEEWEAALLDQPMVLDMDPESSYIQSMIQDSTNRRLITSIDGAEESGQLFRMIASAIPEQSANTSNEQIYEDISNKLIELETDVLYAMNWLDRTRRYFWIRIFLPNITSAMGYVSSTLSSFASLLRYINVDIHTDWAEEIGAYHFEERVIRIPIYSDGNFETGGNGGIDGPVVDIPGEQVGGFGEIIGYTEEVCTVLINESHDGLIPSSSALIRTTGNSYREATVAGANHLEMGRHLAMQEVIQDELDYYLAIQIVVGPIVPNL